MLDVGNWIFVQTQSQSSSAQWEVDIWGSLLVCLGLWWCYVWTLVYVTLKQRFSKSLQPKIHCWQFLYSALHLVWKDWVGISGLIVIICWLANTQSPVCKQYIWKTAFSFCVAHTFIFTTHIKGSILQAKMHLHTSLHVMFSVNSWHPEGSERASVFPPGTNKSWANEWMNECSCCLCLITQPQASRKRKMEPSVTTHTNRNRYRLLNIKETENWCLRLILICSKTLSTSD